MNHASRLRKRLRRQQARSTVRRFVTRFGSLVRRPAQPMIPLAPFDDL